MVTTQAPLRVLVAYSASSTYVQTTMDYLRSFQFWPDCEIRYVHVTGAASFGFEFDEFDVVINSYCARLCYSWYLSPEYIDRMSRYKGTKILCIQDEYDNVDFVREMMRKIRFDIVFTCVPQDGVEKIYPRSMFPQTQFHTVLTGYVPDDRMGHEVAVPPLADRPIWVGYRGRDIGPRYGQLAYDKFRIGPEVKAVCDRKGIPNDIAVDEASRLYGAAWPAFLTRCRTMLGSESGSNVFDFDGGVQKLFEQLKEEQGRVPSYAEFLPLIADREGLVDMGQISPRVFECAYYRTVMVLFRGRYSDILEPDVHYVPLDKDLGNIDEVLARIADLEAMEEMVERAHRDIIRSGEYTYKAFAAFTSARAREVVGRKTGFLRRPTSVRTSVRTEFPSLEPLGLAHVETMERLREYGTAADDLPWIRDIVLLKGKGHLEKLSKLIRMLERRTPPPLDLLQRARAGEQELTRIMAETRRCVDVALDDHTGSPNEQESWFAAATSLSSDLPRRMDLTFGAVLKDILPALEPGRAPGLMRILDVMRLQAELTYALRLVTVKQKIREMRVRPSMGSDRGAMRRRSG